MDTIKDTIQKFIKGLFYPDNKRSLLPNWLSFSRVIGGLAIPIMAYTKAPLPVLFGSISFLAVSDFLDGLTARVIAKEETKEGAMLDAVSDKIFSLLLIIGIIPILPVFAINGLLEGAIAIVNSKNLSEGGTPKSNFLGKVKIWPLSIALILGYLALAIQNLNIAGITNETLLAISTVLSVGTMPLQAINVKQYYSEYKRQKEENKDAEENQNNEENQDALAPEKEHTLSNENQITPKLKLSKEKHQAMVYKLPSKKETMEDVKEKPKTLKKKL